MYSFDEVRQIIFKIKADLLKIADERELEELRSNVELYFKDK